MIAQPDSTVHSDFVSIACEPGSPPDTEAEAQPVVYGNLQMSGTREVDAVNTMS